MNSDRPLWPRWARNLFLIQLMLNLVIWIAVFGFIFAGRVRQRVEVESLGDEVATQERELEKLRDEVSKAKDDMRGWWDIDSRNLRKEIMAEVEKTLEEDRR